MVDPSTRPDHAVLDAARMARAAQAANDEACRRFGAIEDAFLALVPEQPIRPGSDKGRELITAAVLRLLNQFPTLTPEVDAAVSGMRDRTVTTMQETWEAWEADRRRWHEESGAAAADAEVERSLDVMIVDVERVAALHAATLDGLLAKASVFRPAPDGDEPDHHYQALAMSVMRDLAAMLAGRDAPSLPGAATTTAASAP